MNKPVNPQNTVNQDLTRRNIFTFPAALLTMGVAVGQSAGEGKTMNRATYDEFVALFNQREIEKAAARFFMDDIVFEFGGAPALRGAKAFVDRFFRVHDGLTETLRPRVVLIGDGYLFSEVDADFVALKDNDKLASGPMKAGEKITRTAFSLYQVKGGRFSHVKVANWVASI